MKESSFWGINIIPGEIKKIPMDVPSTLIVTNACLGISTEKNPKGRVRVIAHTKTPDLSKYTEDDTTYQEEQSTICVLLPGREEQKPLRLKFSPFQEVSFEVQGSYPVSLAGCLEMFDDSDVVNEEEEDDSETESEEVEDNDEEEES